MCSSDWAGFFTGVDIQPGKPQGHGMINNTPVVCLPGNPLSAFVSFELFVRPLIRKLGGHKVWDNPEATATTAAELKRAKDRTRYLPAQLDWSTMTVDTPQVPRFSSSVDGGESQLSDQDSGSAFARRV